MMAANAVGTALDDVSDDPNAAVLDRPTVDLENGIVYTGQWKGRKKHGKGKQVWSDGAYYVGEWKEGRACGELDRMFCLDKPSGSGSFQHADGDRYSGNWENDQANGYGVLKHKDGSMYVEWTSLKIDLRYEGHWKDDIQHGEAKETWADGSRFEGIYV